MAPVGEPGVRARAVDVRISVYRQSGLVQYRLSSHLLDRLVHRTEMSHNGYQPEPA